ncbi:hypothetical protein FWH13_03070 [Candidatus Saccharibacteria bacterium]|nr:hypothetical protein [Candidatus Saccharibacteria bacterium]
MLAKYHSEAILHQQVADYLRLQYPDVPFRTDYAAGLKMTMGQAAKQKRLQGGRKAWPDLFIAHPSTLRDHVRTADGSISYLPNAGARVDFHGLFIELKREGERLKKRNGEWATEHITEQAKTLDNLRDNGYMAEFAVGFDEAKKIIDEYLGGAK